MEPRPESLSDDDLCERCLQGPAGRDAFEALVQRHHGAALRFATWHLGDAQAAHDIAQETFLRAYAQIRRYEPGTNFRAWLLTIARFLCLAERKRSKRRPSPLPLDSVAEPAAAHPEGPDAESLLRLREAYAKLPLPQREVVALRIFDGLKYREISRITGEKEATLRSRLHDALEKLRRIF